MVTRTVPLDHNTIFLTINVGSGTKTPCLTQLLVRAAQMVTICVMWNGFHVKRSVWANRKAVQTVWLPYGVINYIMHKITADLLWLKIYFRLTMITKICMSPRVGYSFLLIIGKVSFFFLQDRVWGMWEKMTELFNKCTILSGSWWIPSLFQEHWEHDRDAPWMGGKVAKFKQLLHYM